MCSTPPAICTSSQPAAMLMAASLIAWRLDAQLRLIVTPPVSTGRSAASEAIRATSNPCSPCCWTQPQRTSSIRLRLDPRPLDDGAHDVRREVFGADVAEDPLVRRGPPDRGPHGVDHHGMFHGRLLIPIGRSHRSTSVGQPPNFDAGRRQRVEPAAVAASFLSVSVGSNRLPRWAYRPSRSTTCPPPRRRPSGGCPP